MLAIFTLADDGIINIFNFGRYYEFSPTHVFDLKQAFLDFISEGCPCPPSFCLKGVELKLLDVLSLWSQEVGSSAADTTITDRVYFDIMECPSLARSDRTLGNTSLICTDGENLGRIVIGLYGKQVCYLSCLQLSSTYLDTSQTVFLALQWCLSASGHWLFHREHQ